VLLAQQKKTVLVLVVGEASRAENYSLNGYDRETNPELKKENVINFPQASSCGTETAVSVPCMFSGMPRKKYDADLAHHQEGLMDVLNHAGINLLWRDNDGGCKGACDRIPHTDMTQWPETGYSAGDPPDGQPRPGLLSALPGAVPSLYPDLRYQ